MDSDLFINGMGRFNIFIPGNKRRLIISLLVICFLISSCRKDDVSDDIPLLTLTSPLSSHEYSVYDTIFIEGEINHSQPINKISITVTDSDEKPIVSGVTLQVSQSNYILKTFLIIDNKYIAEGQNYLLIRIEDEDNIHNYWFDIKIDPLDKILKKILLVSGSGLENSLYQLDIDGNSEKLMTWNSEYLGGYSDSRNELFYTCGSLVDGLKAFDLNTRAIKWEVNTVPVGGLPYFSSFTASEGNISVGLREGYIESYNSAGLKILRGTELTNGLFYKILHYGNFIASVYKKYNELVSELIIFNNPAGNIFHSIEFSGNIVEMIPGKDGQILLIINQDGVNKLYGYTINKKELVYLDNIMNGEISRVTGNSDNIFLVSGNSIMWYKPAISSNVEYLQIPNIGSIAFDSLNNNLYIGQGDSLKLFTLPSITLKESQKSEGVIRDIDFLYNK